MVSVDSFRTWKACEHEIIMTCRQLFSPPYRYSQVKNFARSIRWVLAYIIFSFLAAKNINVNVSLCWAYVSRLRLPRSGPEEGKGSWMQSAWECTSRWNVVFRCISLMSLNLLMKKRDVFSKKSSKAVRECARLLIVLLSSASSTSHYRHHVKWWVLVTLKCRILSHIRGLE